MATRVYVIWTLILLVGWSTVFGYFDKYFDGVELEKKKVASLERKLHSEDRKVAKLESRFSEFKEALVLAGVKLDQKTPWNDEKRAIASVMADPAFKSQSLWPNGHVSFEHAKKVFISSDYRRSAELFEEFLQKYPDHPSLPEASYFLAESYYQLGNNEGALRALNLLITHFPETESACLGMVRLGKIFEKQERVEDAEEIYQMAQPLYPKSKCAELASRSIQGLNL